MMIRDSVFAAIPVIAARTEQIQRLNAALDKTTKRAATPFRNIDQGVERTVRGQSVDLAQLALQDIDEERSTRARELAAERIRFRIRDLEAHHISESDTRPGFMALTVALARLVDDVRLIDAGLGQVQSLDDARHAGADAAALWLRLADQVESYDQIRAVQLELTMMIRPKGTIDRIAFMERCGYLADAIDHEPFWINRRHSSAATAQHHAGGEAQWVTWLLAAPIPAPIDAIDALTSPWWPRHDRAAYLRHICAMAIPWAPDLEQLTRNHHLATQSTAGHHVTSQANSAASLEMRRRALDEYRQLSQLTNARAA